MGKLKQNNIQTYAKTKYYTSYGITLIALAISRKCVRYEERA